MELDFCRAHDSLSLPNPIELDPQDSRLIAFSGDTLRYSSTVLPIKAPYYDHSNYYETAMANVDDGRSRCR